MKKEIVIICHDEKAMTWDLLNLKDFNDGINFLDCIEEGTDYEKYSDIDIKNLTTKIYNHYNNFKDTINYIVNNNDYEKAYKMNGYCLIVEEP